jgi:hypothetical protein
MSKFAAADVAGSGSGGARGSLNSFGINKMKNSQAAIKHISTAFGAESQEIRNLKDAPHKYQNSREDSGKILGAAHSNSNKDDLEAELVKLEQKDSQRLE